MDVSIDVPIQQHTVNDRAMIVLKTEGGGGRVVWRAVWLGDDNDKEGYYLAPRRVSLCFVCESSLQEATHTRTGFQNIMWAVQP